MLHRQNSSSPRNVVCKHIELLHHNPCSGCTFQIPMYHSRHNRRPGARRRRYIMIICKRFTKKVQKIPCTVVILISAFIFCFYFNNATVKQTFNNKTRALILSNDTNSTSDFQSRIKYILLWTGSTTTPFVYFGIGNKVFKKKKCKWTNCFVTTDRRFLGDYTEFDVIAFNGPQLVTFLAFGDFPVRRRSHQKYVYANIESSANYPLCTNVWNGFFNWTWTYKLNSDAVWGYFAIRDASNHVIGPNQNINWIKIDEMDDIDEEFKDKLKIKSHPAAWFVSNCLTQSLREDYVDKLQDHLKKFNMAVDVFGKCGKFGCPRELMPRCLKTLENKYYFYLAFENAISEDYVTERIMYALNHNTVPIVFGGANYSRFMPDGSYLNANNMKAENLAAKIYHIIKNPPIYHKFFRWKKYYSYHLRHESPETDDYCNFCAKINDEQLMKKTTVYENLNKWWTGSDIEDLCHPTNKPKTQTKAPLS